MVSQRDKIWIATLRALEYNRRVTAYEIQNAIEDDPPAVATVRNTLDAMEELGLLESDGGAGRSPRKFAARQPSPPDPSTGYSSRSPAKKSVFPYPGSKSQLAGWVISNMPDHETYVEGFGGAAAVLFQKRKSKYEIYNEINSDLTHFFQVLRDHTDELAAWLTNVPYSRNQYQQWVEEFYAGYRPEDDIERAGRYFSLRYMQYIGTTDTANAFKARARRSPARSFANAKNRLHSLARRFDEVIIENQGYQAIIDTYDDPAVDVLFFFDPPYPGATEYYDYDNDFRHDEFLTSLTSIENDWMLTYPEVPTMLEGYTVLTERNRSRMKRESGTSDVHLICNFDLENRQAFTDSC